MSAGSQAIRWAPRVSRELIRRLHETDARGIVDEELIDEVAFAFYARCQSIVTATEAYRGRAACPRCETTIPHSHRSDEVLHCANCAWHATWREYRKSYQGKYLVTGNPGGAFTEYPRRVKAARSARERMLAIDWLLNRAFGSSSASLPVMVSSSNHTGHQATATWGVIQVVHCAYARCRTLGSRTPYEISTARFTAAITAAANSVVPMIMP
jgi:hypothetical protein